MPHHRSAAAPKNPRTGWLRFDFESAFGRPVKLFNDAAMQAPGGYRGGKMLFLGFDTELGTALIVNGLIEPMELSHLPYKNGTCEDYVGDATRKRTGSGKWAKHVMDVVMLLRDALRPDDVSWGGGNCICRRLSLVVGLICG